MDTDAKSVPSENPNEYCRLCFSDRNLVSLCQYEEQLRENLLKDISTCTGIQIEIQDNQPCSICWRCAVALEDFQLFRKKCLNNDAIIRSKYSTTTVRHGQDEWLISIPVSELPPDVKEEKDDNDMDLVEPLKAVALPKPKVKRIYGKFSSKKMDELNTGEETQSEKSTTCHLCKHEFVSRQSLYAHFKEQHTERGRPHKCDLCQATFKRKSHLEDHVASHTGEVRYSCKDCGTKYPKAKSLSRHRRICHHERPTNIKPSKRLQPSSEGQFKCNYCPKSFKHRPSLNFHVKSHYELLPFVCDICDARFANQKGKLVHKGKYHPNPVDAFKSVPSASLEPMKKLQCTLCTRYFDQQRFLTQHMKFMHPNEFNDQIKNEEGEEREPITVGDTEDKNDGDFDMGSVTIKFEVEDHDSKDIIGDT